MNIEEEIEIKDNDQNEEYQQTSHKARAVKLSKLTFERVTSFFKRTINKLRAKYYQRKMDKVVEQAVNHQFGGKNTPIDIKDKKKYSLKTAKKFVELEEKIARIGNKNYENPNPEEIKNRAIKISNKMMENIKYNVDALAFTIDSTKIHDIFGHDYMNVGDEQNTNENPQITEKIEKISQTAATKKEPEKNTSEKKKTLTKEEIEEELNRMKESAASKKEQQIEPEKKSTPTVETEKDVENKQVPANEMPKQPIKPEPISVVPNFPKNEAKNNKQDDNKITTMEDGTKLTVSNNGKSKVFDFTQSTVKSDEKQNAKSNENIIYKDEEIEEEIYRTEYSSMDPRDKYLTKEELTKKKRDYVINEMKNNGLILFDEPSIIVESEGEDYRDDVAIDNLVVIRKTTKKVPYRVIEEEIFEEIIPNDPIRKSDEEIRNMVINDMERHMKQKGEEYTGSKDELKLRFEGVDEFDGSMSNKVTVSKVIEERLDSVKPMNEEKMQSDDEKVTISNDGKSKVYDFNTNNESSKINTSNLTELRNKLFEYKVAREAAKKTYESSVREEKESLKTRISAEDELIKIIKQQEAEIKSLNEKTKMHQQNAQNNFKYAEDVRKMISETEKSVELQGKTR